MRIWKRSCSETKGANWWWLIGVSLLACVAVMVASICLGVIPLTLEELVCALSQGPGTGWESSIVWYARLPRTLASVFAGAALSASGAVLQNVLANKLASSNVIGVNAGAGLGVTLCAAAGIISGWGISLAAFGGSLAVVLGIALFVRRAGVSRTTVILCGVALNSILNAMSESVSVLIPDATTLGQEFRVGGFSSVTYARLLPAMVLIIGALLVLFTLCNELDIVALGDETAQGVGLPVRQIRVLFLVLAALLAGAAVSFAGLLGFVGLIVPHLARRVVGNESRWLLPICVIWGGEFVTACDLLARLMFAPHELPVGILMSIIGGPVFMVLLLRYRGGHRND